MENSDIMDELIQLCNLAITLLQKAKDDGLISDEEYSSHIKSKKEFLDRQNYI